MKNLVESDGLRFKTRNLGYFISENSYRQRI
jgi:hypothetical protein